MLESSSPVMKARRGAGGGGWWLVAGGWQTARPPTRAGCRSCRLCVVASKKREDERSKRSVKVFFIYFVVLLWWLSHNLPRLIDTTAARAKGRKVPPGSPDALNYLLLMQTNDFLHNLLGRASCDAQSTLTTCKVGTEQFPLARVKNMRTRAAWRACKTPRPTSAFFFFFFVVVYSDSLPQ